MQWLTNLPLGDNRTLQIVALCAVVIVAIVALIIAYRAFFGHRLRFSGAGRARQPRLGLVDAFSLDGQRQLVLVRRDNIEHLLMIGGPNDVVVESQIIRAQPQALGPREKDASLPAVAPAAPKQVAPVEAQPASAKVSAAPTISPLRAVMQTGPTAAQGPARAPVRTEPPIGPQARAPQPAPPPPQQSPPPQPPAPQPPASVAPSPAPPKPAAEPAEGRNAPSAPKPLVLPLRQGAPAPAKPSPLPPPIVVAPAPTAPPVAAPKPLVIPTPTPAGSAPKPAPSPQIVPPPPAAGPPPKPAPNPPAPAAPSTAPAAPAAKNDPFAELDSLEAEMARLLGRDP